MQTKFNRSLVGGTFDRFHVGHRKLLMTAFEQSEKVIIGIATDALFKNKSFAHLIEDYKKREKSVTDFLAKAGLEDRFVIEPIHDFYGTSLTDKNLDAIFITVSNKENVQKINAERKKKEFKPLEIISVPYVLGDDDEIVSSERIRMGEIDREGNSYKKVFISQEEFHLPEKVREELRQPVGPIEKDVKDVIRNQDMLLITVGDIVSQSFAVAGRQADISIIDGKTRREIVQKDSFSIPQTQRHEAQNPAGIITKSAVDVLQNALNEFIATHKKQLVVVSGEEDLLAIPAIMLSPLQSVVIYGQFDEGIVVVKVTEQNKKRVLDLFRKFY